MPPKRPPSTPLTVLDDPGRVSAALSPLRRELLDRLTGQPDSASGLSRRMGLTRQKLNYHLRELERHGFLELHEEHQRRGCVERTLRVTAQAFVIDPGLLGGHGAAAEAADQLSSSHLIATAARLLTDAAALQRGAKNAARRLATLTLETEVRFSTAAQRAAFAEELGAALARLTAKYHDESPGARAFRFVLAGHPVRKTPTPEGDPR